MEKTNIEINKALLTKIEALAKSKKMNTEEYLAKLVDQESITNDCASDYYTSEEVCEKLHITKQTLYSYISQGKLKTIKLGKYHLISHVAYDNFINSYSK